MALKIWRSFKENVNNLLFHDGGRRLITVRAETDSSSYSNNSNTKKSSRQNDVPRIIVLSIYLGCTEFSAAENICHTAQQVPGLSFPSPSAVITAPRDSPLYHSAQLLLMLTERAPIGLSPIK